jgi:hypothetical protein
MAYDNDNSLRQPQPPKKDSDIGSWIFIAVMFTVAWPIGLILLLIKLSESGNKKKNSRRTTGQSGQRTSQRVTAASPQAEKARSAVEQVTRTPDYTDKGTKTMKIIGAILGILGCVALFSAVGDNLSYAYHYNEWWYFARQLFYPLGMLAGGASLLLGSGAMKRRQRRFATYLRTAGQKPAVPLDYLARAANVSRRRVEKDVNLMLEKGLWGDEAYIDLGSGMLFRSQAAATAYFDKARQMQQPEEPAVQPQAAEGYAGVLRQIRELNDRIADEALSAKIDRIEQVSGRIFKAIEDDPAKKGASGTFLNYYLPTTLKLLENYADFEETGVSGENLSQAKSRIEATMDSIVVGFEHQLDELYRTDAMDIDSDIRVMETMLRRDTASVADDFGLGGAAAQRQSEEE